MKPSWMRHFVDAFLDMHAHDLREEIVIDLDATDDPVHGKQEGGRVPRILPALLLSAPLHHLRQPCARRTGPPLEDRFGEGCARGVEAGGRADPGPLAGGADHGSRRFGFLPRPDHGVVRGGGRGSAMSSAWRATRDSSGGSQRIWRWPRRHAPRAGRPRAASGSCATGRWTAGAARWRVVGKAEWLPGPRGSNPRFVVTDIPAEELEARILYEELYCARGEMENRT